MYRTANGCTVDARMSVDASYFQWLSVDAPYFQWLSVDAPYFQRIMGVSGYTVLPMEVS